MILEQSNDIKAVNATIYIGMDYLRRGEVEAATHSFRTAAARKSTWGLRELANTELSRGRFLAAAKALRKSADLGDGCSMTLLGWIAYTYLEDVILAERWYRRATESGCAGGMFYLGLLLEEFGYLYEKEQDDKRKSAEYWYRSAAVEGDSLAMNRLGQLYEEIFEYEAAARWYRKSAKTGSVVAFYNLAAILPLLDKGEDAEAALLTADRELASAIDDRPYEFPPKFCRQ